MNIFFSESPCSGVAYNDHIQGNTAADTVENLRSLFCGCKFITRGVSINLLDGNSQIFGEEDFNVFFHLQEIRNVLYLNNVNVNGGRIIFPNLRIIRGESFFRLNGEVIALRVNNVNASELIMPRLTEITTGGVAIINNPQQALLNVRQVLWSDIVDRTRFVVLWSTAKVRPNGESFKWWVFQMVGLSNGGSFKWCVFEMVGLSNGGSLRRLCNRT